MVLDLVLGAIFYAGDGVLFDLLGVDILLATRDETQMLEANGSKKETTFGEFLDDSS